MKFKKLLKRISLSILIPPAFFFGLVAFQQFIQWSEYRVRDYHSICRPIGIFTSIECSRYDSKSLSSREFVVNKNYGLFRKSYIDESEDTSLDGKVDKIKIQITELFKSRYLYRNKHYQTHKEDFDEGDRMLKQYEPKFQNLFEKVEIRGK